MRVYVLALALLVHGGAEAASRRTIVSFNAPDIRPSFSFDKAYETGPMLNLTGVLTIRRMGLCRLAPRQPFTARPHQRLRL
jgi:hypothetical protein